MGFYLTQSLHRGMRDHPDRLAVVCGDIRRSFSEFGDRVARLAGVLRGLGLEQGDRVGMLSFNSDRYLEYLFGVLWAGGVATPINYRWTASEIADAVCDSDMRVLLVGAEFGAVAGEVRRQTSNVRHWICVGETAPEGMLSYDALISDAGAIGDVVRRGDEPALLLYTGGTTGRPKGVVLSHTNMAAACLGVEAMIGEPGSRFLHVAPMFHMADIQMIFFHCLGGGAHIIEPLFDPLRTFWTIQREGITDILVVPTMLQALVDHERRMEFDTSSLTRIFYGAAPITASAMDRALAAFPNAAFVQGYGMTETALICMLPAPYHNQEGRKANKLASAGKALPHAEIKIVGPDGAEVPTRKVGEIAARGPSVMSGYWRNEHDTANVLREGWMHTGDGAYRDEDGFIFIVDRIKDMIITGGENVYSGEVESAIARHPAVAACAVIGLPDERWGEVVTAIVILRKEQALTLEQLQLHCRTLIAGYKCPRRLELRTQLPLSAAGKVHKNELRKDYA